MPSSHITPAALKHSAQALAQEVDVLFRSGASIVAIATVDPLSTTRILNQFVKNSTENLITNRTSAGIMGWSYSHGFGYVDENGIVTDFIEAGHTHKTSAAISLTVLNQSNLDSGTTIMPDIKPELIKILADKGITVFQLPQSEISDNGNIKNWTVVQQLIEIGTKFKYKQTTTKNGKQVVTGERRMLVLLVPSGFVIPSVLKDNMVLLTHHTPGSEEREQILSNVLNLVNKALAEQEKPSIDFSEKEKHDIIAVGSSLTQSEFSRALSRAFVLHRNDLGNLTASTFLKVLSGIKAEVVASSKVLEVLPSVDSTKVGGLEIVKKWIRDRVPCFGPEAEEFGIDKPKGIALIGPPGTGKSLIAKTISSELGIPCIKLDVGSIFDSLVGASEARLRDALLTIQTLSPCVLFIDEVDKAFDTRNSGGDSGVGKRIFGTLLNWMQENTTPVFIVVTANNVEHLPPEFLRKGRLDEVFSISLPAYASRLEVLKIHLRNRKKDPEKITGLETAALHSKGYTPSEIESAVNEALIQSFSRNIPITGELILQQLRNSKPLSESHAKSFAAMQSWAETNARKATEDNFEPEIDENVNVDNSNSTGLSVHL